MNNQEFQDRMIEDVGGIKKSVNQLSVDVAKVDTKVAGLKETVKEHRAEGLTIDERVFDRVDNLDIKASKTEATVEAHIKNPGAHPINWSTIIKAVGGVIVAVIGAIFAGIALVGK